MKNFLNMLRCIFSGVGIFFAFGLILTLFNHGELNLGPLSSFILIFISIFFAIILDIFIEKE